MARNVVVDGSNLATEGRMMPSLKQLVDAVQAYMEENPDDLVTVVVDATFGHRIDPKEVAEFDAAVEHNELVAPPAGAVGRGDAFVLKIADKVGAVVISNDSYQEFHGEYDWLFDEGRLIGGKPVPHVGWVFVPRVPVRGPISRRAQREAKRKEPTPRASRAPKASKAAQQPMPVPSTPPPAVKREPVHAGSAPAATKRSPAHSAPPATSSSGRGGDAAEAGSAGREPASRSSVNDLMPFLSFVEKHPVGSSVNAVVTSYASHGANVHVGDIKGYVPLRLMADPPPRSAREAMKVGDAVTVVVAAYHASRRGIDLAVPGAVSMPEPPPPAAPRRRRRAAPEEVAAAVMSGATSVTDLDAVLEATAGGVVATDATPARPAKKAASKKVASKKAAAPTKKAAGTKKEAAKKPAPAKKAAAKKAAAERAPAPTKKAAGAPAPSPISADPAHTEPPAAVVEPRQAANAAKRAPAKKTAAKASARKAAPSKAAPSNGAPSPAAPTKAAASKTAAPAKKPSARRAPAKRSAASDGLAAGDAAQMASDV